MGPHSSEIHLRSLYNTSYVILCLHKIYHVRSEPQRHHVCPSMRNWFHSVDCARLHMHVNTTRTLFAYVMNKNVLLLENVSDSSQECEIFQRESIIILH